MTLSRLDAKPGLRAFTTRQRKCSPSGPYAFAAKPPVSFPEKVTAFRPEMAVHGRYKKPCPVCGTRSSASPTPNETNYCPSCQTGGKLLGDRALSRLLKDDWPKTLEELEETRRR